MGHKKGLTSSRSSIVTGKGHHAESRKDGGGDVGGEKRQEVGRAGDCGKVSAKKGHERGGKKREKEIEKSTRLDGKRVMHILGRVKLGGQKR